MTTILAIDQGTTGTTCLVVDAAGRVRGRGYRELAQSYPAPGWVEHDPLEILATVRAAARQAVAAAGAPPAAIGITNQRETVVLWERDTGRPLSRSQSTTVSRWFVMPIAAGGAPAAATASRAAARTVARISSASCSTSPGAGYDCASSR